MGRLVGWQSPVSFLSSAAEDAAAPGAAALVEWALYKKYQPQPCAEHHKSIAKLFVFQPAHVACDN